MVSTTALVLLAAYRWWDRPSVRSAALFGALVGLAALPRSEALLLGPFIGVPLVWFRRRGACDRCSASWRRRAPWRPSSSPPGWATTWPRFEEPTTLSAQFDQTLGTANCEDVYYGDRIGYWQLACIQRVEYLVGEGAPRPRAGASADRPAVHGRQHRSHPLRGGRPLRPHVRRLQPGEPGRPRPVRWSRKGKRWARPASSPGTPWRWPARSASSGCAGPGGRSSPWWPPCSAWP